MNARCTKSSGIKISVICEIVAASSVKHSSCEAYLHNSANRRKVPFRIEDNVSTIRIARRHWSETTCRRRDVVEGIRAVIKPGVTAASAGKHTRNACNLQRQLGADRSPHV